jgi:hypothetical protein
MENWMLALLLAVVKLAFSSVVPIARGQSIAARNASWNTGKTTFRNW